MLNDHELIIAQYRRLHSSNVDSDKDFQITARTRDDGSANQNLIRTVDFDGETFDTIAQVYYILNF